MAHPYGVSPICPRAMRKAEGCFGKAGRQQGFVLDRTAWHIVHEWNIELAP